MKNKNFLTPVSNVFKKTLKEWKLEQKQKFKNKNKKNYEN